jgi:methylase of polypeptide subunit release factors
MDFYGKIEDLAGLPNDVLKIISTTLISGKTITVPVWLQGGGQVHKKYFLKAIGNKKYTNAFEWCAGHGEIGFELITAGICKTLEFSDMHPKSAAWCLRNAEDLGLADCVNAHTSFTIEGISANRKWDLVVGNPPNSIDPDPVMVKNAPLISWSPDHLLLYARTTWDSDLRTHKEFFKNIGNYTTDDVDIFITIHSPVHKLIAPIAEDCGFIVVNIIDMFPDPYPDYFSPAAETSSPTDPDLKVVHFRKKS